MGLIDTLKAAILSAFQSEVSKFKSFLKNPASLVALFLAAFSLVNSLFPKIRELFADKNVSEDDIESYVKNNRNLQKFINFTSSQIDDSAVSDIILACENPEYYNKQIENLITVFSGENISGEDFIKIANQISDFDNKTESTSVSNNLLGITQKIEGILPWVFLTYYIGLKIKEFLNQNDYPSIYRGKYLQRLIRNTTIILKENIRSETKAAAGTPSAIRGFGKSQIDQANKLIGNFKTLDTIIGAVLMGSFIYLYNRKLIQKNSQKNFEEEVNLQSCEIVAKDLTDEETSPKNIIPFNNLSNDKLIDSLNNENCNPIGIEKEDDYIVPHLPIELVDINFCETPIQAEASVVGETTPQPDLACKALFENKTEKSFNIIIKKDLLVNGITLIATYDNKKIYSPLEGKVIKIEKNKIYLDNIIESNESYLESLIQKTQDYYKELNNLKFFLKDFYVESMYPVMLKNTTVDISILAAAGVSVKDVSSFFISPGNLSNNNQILFPFGGVQSRWENSIEQKKIQNANFERKAQEIAGPDNVKTKAENEQLQLIKEELDAEQELLFSLLKTDVNIGINQSKVTIPLNSEFNLIDYYFKLSESLASFYDKNDTVNAFIKIISEILINRYFIDKYSFNQIKERIQNYAVELTIGNLDSWISQTNIPDYYTLIKTKYDNTDPKSGQKTDVVKNYLTEIGKSNKNISENRKQELVSIISFLFDFSLTISQLLSQNFSTKTNKFQATISEGTSIEKFFNTSWLRYDELKIAIEDNYKEMDNIYMFFNAYTTIEIDGEEYRYYVIGNESTCPKPLKESEYLSPHTKIDPSDIRYWLKYCAFATLASVATPGIGWATGIPPPIGPVSLPIVYIPIKAFQLPWGFMVIGLTITGMFPFPWVLFVNYSAEYHVPFIDPVAIIKREIAALKKAISDGFKTFKKDFLKSYLDKTKSDIEALEYRLLELADLKRNNKLVKPKLDRNLPIIKRNILYEEQFTEWETNRVSIEEEILTIKKRKWILEKKYEIIKELYDGTLKGLYKKKDIEVDPPITTIQITEENLDNSLEKLNIMEIGLPLLLAPLPLATNPGTANFAITIKSPKPLNKIESNINETLNSGAVSKIISKFDLKNEDVMNTNAIQQGTTNTIKFLKKDLIGAMMVLVLIDPFPKYENLKPINIPWMTFLLTAWAPTGAKCFGIPGFP